jgi:hypothetical protein
VKETAKWSSTNAFTSDQLNFLIALYSDTGVTDYSCAEEAKLHNRYLEHTKLAIRAAASETAVLQLVRLFEFIDPPPEERIKSILDNKLRQMRANSAHIMPDIAIEAAMSQRQYA